MLTKASTVGAGAINWLHFPFPFSLMRLKRNYNYPLLNNIEWVNVMSKIFRSSLIYEV